MTHLFANLKKSGRFIFLTCRTGRENKQNLHQLQMRSVNNRTSAAKSEVSKRVRFPMTYDVIVLLSYALVREHIRVLLNSTAIFALSCFSLFPVITCSCFLLSTLLVGSKLLERECRQDASENQPKFSLSALNIRSTSCISLVAVAFGPSLKAIYRNPAPCKCMLISLGAKQEAMSLCI